MSHSNILWKEFWKNRISNQKLVLHFLWYLSVRKCQHKLLQEHSIFKSHNLDHMHGWLVEQYFPQMLGQSLRYLSCASNMCMSNFYKVLLFLSQGENLQKILPRHITWWTTPWEWIHQRKVPILFSLFWLDKHRHLSVTRIFYFCNTDRMDMPRDNTLWKLLYWYNALHNWKIDVNCCFCHFSSLC